MGNTLKHFFVSKSDEAKIKFINKYIKRVKPSNIFILCESDRKHLFQDIDNSMIVGFKKLNETENWINFVNGVNEETLLIVDNIVKFIFFGDGKKKYLTQISQSIDRMIVMDSVPFFEEVSQMYYPFYFLGKDILGYNNYSAFKANHFEEAEDGSINKAHSFKTLKSKIQDYYIQDYKKFFTEKEDIWWEMSESEKADYEEEKERTTNDMDNPIAIFNQMSTKINLIKSKFERLSELTKGSDHWNIILNAGGRFPVMIKKHLENKNVSFHSFHDKNTEKYKEMDNLIYLETPIVKAYKLFYIDALLKPSCKVYLFRINNNLETYFYNRVFNNELRNEFDKHFGK